MKSYLLAFFIVFFLIGCDNKSVSKNKSAHLTIKENNNNKTVCITRCGSRTAKVEVA